MGTNCKFSNLEQCLILMGKGKAQPIIWLLLEKGFKPVEIIELGFKKTTVYSCAAKWPEIKRQYEKILERYRRLNKLKEA